jgi:hypothetical protein
MAWTYKRTSERFIEVLDNGAYAGWLERVTQRPKTGLLSYWTGRVAGRPISANNLTAAKAKIERIR